MVTFLIQIWIIVNTWDISLCIYPLVLKRNIFFLTEIIGQEIRWKWGTGCLAMYCR